MKLTKTQQEVIIKMFREESDLYRNRGGFWVTQNTIVKKENNSLVPEWCVKTGTVNTLLKCNLVDYKGSSLNNVALTQKGNDEAKYLLDTAVYDDSKG